MHDNYVYEVEYIDGKIQQLIANIIPENMPSQVDSEGHHYQVFNEVNFEKIDGRAIIKMDDLINFSNGNLHQKKNTNSCKLLV